MSRQPLDLSELARQAMLNHGFQLDTPPQAEAEIARLAEQPPDNDGIKDWRRLLWSSIDEASSRDLDQLEFAERLPDGDIRVLIAIADVDEFAPEDSALNAYAQANGNSVYTGVVTFPMLPEELSTDMTSLRDGADRLALVVELIVDADGNLKKRGVRRALVHNYAKLSYREVGRWLDGDGPKPETVRETPGLDKQIRLQWEAAQRLRELRKRNGMLKFQSTEVQPVVEDGKVVGLKSPEQNSARSLIENFMIAANGAIADFLESHNFPGILRIVRTPARWPRIVEIARSLGDDLPEEPDAPALSAFLERRRAADPLHFADLSLSVVKLLGPGEYAVKEPGVAQEGHFSLAVRSYTHFTAPNRRYADVVMQRLVKAVLSQQNAPYNVAELDGLARHCTEREDAARKVERLMRKTIAAVSLHDRIGEEFDAIVTGAKSTGTYARLLKPPVDGRIERGEQGLQVGDQVRVRLIDTDPERGYIDFARVK
jgi:exoribonuclease-2